jgi:wyosine [tRNA(Phe)-imidazoG37] synthetase (radical SAM superfamily)
MTEPKDFYCSQKFWWLSVDVEKLETHSCCAANPQKIDLSLLKKEPGNLFNTSALQKDRRSMLDNQPVSTCAEACWIPESQGITSRRLFLNSNIKSHHNIISSPEVLHINLGSTCNMTCVYCTKQYSSAWYRDIKSESYKIETNNSRYTVTVKDTIVNKLSQKNIYSIQSQTDIFSELSLIAHLPSVTRINITGGEPFLYLYLENLIEKLPKDKPIEIVTGLGVDKTRFIKVLNSLKDYNIIITASGESTKKLYEFVRYGNTWDRYLDNLNEIKKRSIPYEYSCTLSNLTIFGLDEFIKNDPYGKIHLGLCNDPDFLSMHVMDDKSKEIVYNKIDQYPNEAKKMIETSLKVKPTDQQVSNFKKYIIEFSNRRSLKLDVFPDKFIEWINNVV